VNDREAAANLEVIRTLMERSALYRRALAPVALAAGGLGVLAATLGWLRGIQAVNAFAGLWLATAVVAGVAGLGIIRGQAVRAGEPFLSPPTRRIAGALLPGYLLGALAGLAAILMGERVWLQAFNFQLVALWLAAYGLALHAAGAFMPRHVRWLAWAFVAASLSLWLLWSAIGLLPPNVIERLLYRPAGPHGIMGLTFGGLHLVYGLALLATERRRPAP
jgi:hypothetical protein